MKNLKLRDKVLSIPLIQGGMGVGISLSNLAGAVAKCGGMGVISAAHPGYRKENFRKDSITANCEAIVEEIAKAKQISNNNGLVAVNVMVAGTDYETYVKAAVEGKVDAIISGAGLPLDLPNIVEDENILIAPIVSSKKACELVLKVWDRRYSKTADFIVIESAQAGGHLGFKPQDILDNTAQTLEEILLEVKEVVDIYEEKYNRNIPVIVAGGIYDNNDIIYYLNKGADGVQMATRFIATHECDADIKFKEAIVNCTKEDIDIVVSPTGFPGRALNNAFFEKVKSRGNVSMKKCLNCMKPCNPLDTPYCISEALILSAKGFVEQGVVFVGSNAYKIKEIVSVEQLINQLFPREV